jgi:hypothetical protein
MILIDTVYQKVLALANKEQRGYITPQDFNLFADQAQMEIFEQYFYDLNQLLKTNNNSDEYANVRDNIQEKITIFEQNSSTTGNTIDPDAVYRLGTISTQYLNYFVEVEEVQQGDLTYILQGSLTKPTDKKPIYVRKGKMITIYPTPPGDFYYNYIRRPEKPNWTYVVINNQALFDANSTTLDFELHASEENQLVNKILRLAGVSNKQPDIMQAGQGMDMATVQQQLKI